MMGNVALADLIEQIYLLCSPLAQVKRAVSPKRIIRNGVATVVFWEDGTKTVVKRAEGTADDPYQAFCAALAIKTFGSNSALKRMIRNAGGFEEAE